MGDELSANIPQTEVANHPPTWPFVVRLQWTSAFTLRSSKLSRFIVGQKLEYYNRILA